MEWIADPQAWIAFLTLAALEIVLGIDNIVFISILVGKLPAHQQARAYRIGLGLAMVMRILLLLSLSWIMGLTEPLFTIPLMGQAVTGRDLVLIVGGLFLVAKSTHEIHDKLEGHEGEKSARVAASYASVLAQIMALDIVFSLDSVITAVGMVQQVGDHDRGRGRGGAGHDGLREADRRVRLAPPDDQDARPRLPRSRSA